MKPGRQHSPRRPRRPRIVDTVDCAICDLQIEVPALARAWRGQLVHPTCVPGGDDE